MATNASITCGKYGAGSCNVVIARSNSTLSMATPRYNLNTTLPTGHNNSIVALQFSPDGKFLASGSGDGVLMVFSTSTWKPIKRYVDTSSLTTVIWHPTFPKTLMCGYSSGDVHTVNFESHLLVSVYIISLFHYAHISRSTIATKYGPIKWAVLSIALLQTRLGQRSRYRVDPTWLLWNSMPFVS